MNKTARNICIGLLALIIIVGILCWIFAAGGGRKAKPEPAGGKTEQTEETKKDSQIPPIADSSAGKQDGETAQTGGQPGNESGALNGNGEESEFVSSRPETQMLSAAIEGEMEGFAANLFCGMLEDGGSRLPYSLYYDAELFTPAQESGRFENEYGALMDFKFHAGRSKDEVSPSAADDYIKFTSIEFLENEDFSGRTANIVQASSGSEYCEVCVFDCEGGCVSAALLCSREAMEGMLRRMEAMAASFDVE